MSFDIPAHIEPQVQKFARAQHISENEALLLIIEAGLEVLPMTEISGLRPSYGSLFGAVKNGYGSPEAVDRAIDEMRSEW